MKISLKIAIALVIIGFTGAFYNLKSILNEGHNGSNVLWGVLFDLLAGIGLVFIILSNNSRFIDLIDKTKAYWLRFWHSLYYTFKETGKDHREYTEYSGRRSTYIGCCCGKSYYGVKQVILEQPKTEEKPTLKPQKGKYILYKNGFRMSFSVDYHLELVPKDGDLKYVRGGGHVYLDHEKKMLLLYSLSTQFGYADKTELKMTLSAAMFTPRLNGYKITHSLEHKLEEALKKMEYIQTIKP